MRGSNPAGAESNGPSIHLAYSELLEPLDGSHNVDQCVNRTDLMERDFVRRQAMDSSLGLTQESEGTHGSFANPGREISPLHQLDQLANVTMRPGVAGVNLMGIVFFMVVVIGTMMIERLHGRRRFFPEAPRQNDVHLGGVHPAAFHGIAGD